MLYAIPEVNFESLEKKVKKIRNKCEKYGCEFKFEKVGSHVEEVEYTDSESGKKFKDVINYIDVDCEGVAKVNGWQFAASLEYTDKGNLIKGVPGIEIPERFYKCGPWCEHCKTNRDRRYSYVVFNEESGEFKQVGKACLKDFTNGLSVEMAAAMESFLKELEESREYYGCDGFARNSFYEVKGFLRYCAESIRVFGFCKNSDAYESASVSTAYRSKIMYRVDNNFLYSKGEKGIYDETVYAGFDLKNNNHDNLIHDVLDWIENAEESSNYIHNLKVACGMEWSDDKSLGLLASAIPAYNRAMGIKAEKEARDKANAEIAAKSNYVGEVGKRVSFAPESIECVTSWETMYGTTFLYKMFDKAGNEFVWKSTSSNNPIGCADEEITEVSGTVKEHKEYRGVKQTELTRCRFKSVPSEKKMARMAAGKEVA